MPTPTTWGVVGVERRCVGVRVRDEVLDMPVTADMGYCLSIHGLAREAAQSLGVASATR